MTSAYPKLRHAQQGEGIQTIASVEVQLEKLAEDYRECGRVEENSREKRGEILKKAHGLFDGQKSFLAWTKAEFGISKSETYECMGDLKASRNRNKKSKQMAVVRESGQASAGKETTEDPTEDQTEEITADTPLRVNDPRAPLTTAPNPDLLNTMTNSWEACLQAFKEATSAQRMQFRSNCKRHSKDLIVFMSNKARA